MIGATAAPVRDLAPPSTMSGRGRPMPEGWRPKPAADYSVETLGDWLIYDVPPIPPAGTPEWPRPGHDVPVWGPWDRVRTPSQWRNTPLSERFTR